MSKFKTLQAIKAAGIVAVIRADSTNKALDFVDACLSGGINIIEITFTIPFAIDVLKTAKTEFNEKIILGAGTVLDSISARLAIINGAKFIVSPSFDKDVAKLCNLYQIPYIPGCMTPTEITQALKYGADLIKIFPSASFGPQYCKDIKGPFPNVNLMPTGGINIENVGEWIRNGAFAVAVGSTLLKGSKEEITTKARLFLKNIEDAKNE